ncbi:hypothetical protein MUG91_G53n105 [Manis pentadactyla]|nr:hypothetical protein MUG91_G53n105 [Manis pentadactyla]
MFLTNINSVSITGIDSGLVTTCQALPLQVKRKNISFFFDASVCWGLWLIPVTSVWQCGVRRRQLAINRGAVRVLKRPEQLTRWTGINMLWTFSAV